MTALLVVALLASASTPDPERDLVEQVESLRGEPAAVTIPDYSRLKGRLLDAGREDLLEELLAALIDDRRQRRRWGELARFEHEAGTNLANLHRFAEAAAALDSALVAIDRAAQDDPLLRGRSHVFLAAIHATLDNLDVAERHLQRGERVLDGFLRVGSPDWAQISTIVAQLVRDLRGLPAGIDAHLDLLREFEGLEEPRPVQEAWARHNLGTLYMESLRFVEAEEQFRRALEMREAALGPENVFAGTTHHEIARARRRRGDFRTARTELSRAIDIYEAQQERPDWVYVGALQDLADLHLWTGDPARCLELTQSAMETSERLESPYPERARFWHSLGRAHLEMGRAREAVDALERGLQEERTRGRPSMRRLLRLRFSSARARLLTDEKERALEELRRLSQDLAREMPEAQILAARVQLERALAADLRRNGEDDAARRALRALEEVLPAAHPDLVQARIEVAWQRLRDGDPEGAWELGQRGMDESLLLLRDATRIMTEEHALLFARELQQTQALQLAALARLSESARHDLVVSSFEDLVLSRGLVLTEMARRNRRPERIDEEQWRSARAELASARADLARLTLFPDASDSNYVGLLRAARERRERAEIRWARRVAGPAPLAPAPDLSALRSVLPDSSALVSYVRWEEEASGARYCAFVLEGGSGASSPRWVDLGDVRLVESRVAAFDDHVRGAARWLRLDPEATERDSRLRLRNVADVVWAPLALDRERIRRLWIVPDGALHRIPFAALPGWESEFLAEEQEILHRLSAERDLLRARPEPRGRGALLVGGVDYARADTRGAWRGPQTGPFAALPASRAEVEAIAELCGSEEGFPTLVLTGVEATEPAVRRAAPGRRILHLATHGFHEPSLDPRRFDTLQRSGVVLAGPNGSETDPAADGLLTAEEISSLPLEGLEWAVVSACDSGAGETWPGEGVVGLQRALLAAGAGTLVASLWPVADDVGQRFMEPLYRHRLVRGRSTAVAVQRSRHEILEFVRSEGRSAHPLRWAGFVAIGDWR